MDLVLVDNRFSNTFPEKVALPLRLVLKLKKKFGEIILKKQIGNDIFLNFCTIVKEYIW